MLVSHVHFDHLDLPSLERLGRSLPVSCLAGAGRLLRKRRFETCSRSTHGEVLRIGAVTVVATEAVHDADRGPLGVKAPSLGFLVRGTRSVYFAGDTDLFPGMADVAPDTRSRTAADLRLGGERRAGASRPAACRRGAALLRPRACVPIHWGTYSPSPWSAAKRAATALPPEEFRQAAAELAPDVRIEVLGRNGVLSLD